MIKKIYKILEEPENVKYGYLIQKLILMNLIINIFSITIPYFFNLSDDLLHVLSDVNKITVIFFIIELLFRYISIGINPQYKGFIGKLKFTFTFYTIIDILSILPFVLDLFSINIVYLKFLRFIRLFKFIRLKKFVKKFINIHYFSSSNVFVQSFILFVISAFIIYVFSYGLDSVKESVSLFLDPSTISDFKDSFYIVIGILELILGLFIGGALISIITSAFLGIIESVKKGYAPYTNEGHILIINENSELEFILSEINYYCLDAGINQDIVILLKDEIEKFKENLFEYKYLNIFVLSGDVLNWNSYERANINYATHIVILNDKKNILENENEKITQFIVSNENFKNNTANFIVEVDTKEYIYKIYEYIFSNKQNRYLLLNHEYIIEQFLNRSVIDYNYFKIYFALLSYSEGYEIYIMNFDDIFTKNISFKEAYLKLNKSILLGVIYDNNKIELNPENNIELNENMKVILLMEDKFSFKVKNIIKNDKQLILPLPSLKEYKKLCIIGEHSDISIENIVNFLDEASIKEIKQIVLDDYFDKKLWDELLYSDFDIIILNLEDEYEFILSMYLKSLYSQDKLNKIVNIFYNPKIAYLLSMKKESHNMILSDQIVGKFIVQNLFNSYAADIFDELTSTKGNEFYILKQDKYADLYKLSYNELKYVLMNNQMIYIGGFINEKFYFNLEDISKLDKIVVLTRGV